MQKFVLSRVFFIMVLIASLVIPLSFTNSLEGFDAMGPLAAVGAVDDPLLDPDHPERKPAIPPIDASAPSKFETATFALG
jgi:hypothetical protein